MSPLGRPGVELRSNTVNETPSKRTSPASVPSQRNPSCDCTRAWTLFCGKPFSITQDWRPYSGREVVGSRAEAMSCEKTQSVVATEAKRCKRRLLFLLRSGLAFRLLNLPGKAFSRLLAFNFAVHIHVNPLSRGMALGPAQSVPNRALSPPNDGPPPPSIDARHRFAGVLRCSCLLNCLYTLASLPGGSVRKPPDSFLPAP